MSLAVLFNIPRDERGLLTFSFHNQDQHLQLVRQIAAQKGVNLTLYAMDPISTKDPATWLEIHQRAHVEFTSVLGIAGVDLMAVNFNDPEQMASWIRLHGDEHQQAANILGIS